MLLQSTITDKILYKELVFVRSTFLAPAHSASSRRRPSAIVCKRVRIGLLSRQIALVKTGDRVVKQYWQGWPLQGRRKWLGAARRRWWCNMSFHDNTEPRQQRPPIYRPKDPPPDVALDRSRIYIGNLPHTVTEDDVRELVEPYGAVRDVFVNSQKGFAFVKMDSPQSAEAVVTNLDMNLRRGRRLRVTPASNAKGKLAKALGHGGWCCAT
ncbi:hypothetical protein MRX96_029258 [Rhipicephalus microplus]